MHHMQIYCMFYKLKTFCETVPLGCGMYCRRRRLRGPNQRMFCKEPRHQTSGLQAHILPVKLFNFGLKQLDLSYCIQVEDNFKVYNFIFCSVNRYVKKLKCITLKLIGIVQNFKFFWKLLDIFKINIWSLAEIFKLKICKLSSHWRKQRWTI